MVIPGKLESVFHFKQAGFWIVQIFVDVDVGNVFGLLFKFCGVSRRAVRITWCSLYNNFSCWFFSLKNDRVSWQNNFCVHVRAVDSFLTKGKTQAKASSSKLCARKTSCHSCPFWKFTGGWRFIQTDLNLNWPLSGDFSKPHLKSEYISVVCYSAA